MGIGCERSGGDPRSEKQKFDGFSLKNGDEGIFKTDVAAGRGRGAERAVPEFEVMGWAGRFFFRFVGGWTKSWKDVGLVAGLKRIISSPCAKMTIRDTEKISLTHAQGDTQFLSLNDCVSTLSDV